jgi:hypothetical protein
MPRTGFEPSFRAVRDIRATDRAAAGTGTFLTIKNKQFFIIRILPFAGNNRH